MKRRIIFGLISLVFNYLVFGQITTTEVTYNRKKPLIKPYDSTKNYLGPDVYQYIGQELYVKGKSLSLRKFGYYNLILDYKISMDQENINRANASVFNKPFVSNVYKPMSGIYKYDSSYKDLVGKYFIVLDVIEYPETSAYYYLKLLEKESNDTIYYRYNTFSATSYPFIVVGYYKKIKNKYAGKEIIIRPKKIKVLPESSIPDCFDINTGEEIRYSRGEYVKCLDLTIEKIEYELALILENKNKQKFAFSLPDEYLSYNIFNPKIQRIFLRKDVEQYIIKFGLTNWKTILNEKIKIGFTKEMVKLSWGQPNTINKTSYNEQWVYSGKYLYFEKGKLTAFN